MVTGTRVVGLCGNDFCAARCWGTKHNRPALLRAGKLENRGYIRKIKNQNEDWLYVSAGGRLRHWRPGALLIRQKPPAEASAAPAARLPSMRPPGGETPSRTGRKNHRRGAGAGTAGARGRGPRTR